MNLILFGAPGAGKGTQSAKLVEELGYKHISTGDLFRYAMKNETALGVEAKKYVDAGKLVPDSIVIGMVDEAFGALAGASFILDGFPRTAPQAEALDNLLESHSLDIDKVIFLEVPKELLLGRLTGRRVCKNCGATYHVEAKPPVKDGVCDVCSSDQVVQRKDDMPEVIEERLEVYENSTAPVKSFYQAQGKLIELDGTGEADDVFASIKGVLS